jgi:hypothetical protein
VWVVNDGSMLRIRSVGTNPTPWFPKRDGHRRRLLRKGDCATLENGDRFGLLTTEPEPGSVRWVAADGRRHARSHHPPGSVEA